MPVKLEPKAIVGKRRSADRDHPVDRHHVFPPGRLHAGQSEHGEPALREGESTGRPPRRRRDKERFCEHLRGQSRGGVFLDKQPVGANELVRGSTRWHHTNENVRVFISGDQDVRYGAVVHVLDLVRSTGIQKVAFEIREPSPAQP